MIDVTAFTQYAQCRVILEALTRAGNRQAQVVQDAIVTDRDAERAKYYAYYALLDAVNQAQMACDGALVTIARAVVASDTPVNDVVGMMYGAGFDWAEDAPVVTDIIRELTAITAEGR
jgi:hypothetical protein